MPTTPRNIRFDDDLYKEMMALAGNQLSGAYHIHLACRQYLARLEPIEELAPKPIAKPKPKMKKFIPPTIEEASNYFNEKGSTVHEAEKFIDFYISKDWMVGKNKMKDWKAATRNWLRGKSNGGQNQSGRNAPANRKLTAIEEVQFRRAEAKRRSGLGVLGDNDNSIPQRMDGNGGNGADGTMGETFDGTFTRTD